MSTTKKVGQLISMLSNMVELTEFTDLRGALGYTPRLRQLQLLVPCSYDDEDESQRSIDIICAQLPRSTNVRARMGDDVGIDEGEFWEAPLRCGGCTL